MSARGFENTAGVAMDNQVVIVDTSFLICLVSETRASHEAAKAYYRFFLEHEIAMLLPTVVIAEFAVKQPPEELPLRNFVIEPFNYETAKTCALLDMAEQRARLNGQGQRDAVKDDFKIIAHAVQTQARYLITDDRDTMAKYCNALKQAQSVSFKVVPLWEPFDVALVNSNGQTELRI